MMGLYLNIPANEAEMDIRHIHCIAAAFSGKDDKYLKGLMEIAWEGNGQRIEKASDLLAISQGERGLPQNKV